MLKEFIMPILLAILIFFLINPLDWWMNNAVYMLLVLLLLLAFSTFSVFFWKEHVLDERESLHRMISGRIAFLIGGGVTVIGIVVQSFSHAIDPWLLAVLLSMVVGKAGAFLWSRSHN